MAFEGFYGPRREGYGAARTILGLHEDEPRAGVPLELATEVNRPGIEIDVGPAQPEQLAYAHACAERHDEQGLESLTSGSSEEAARLL